ncbi:DUF5799 family protein [Natrarchaeobaculum aegyptiacum]|uniref:Uncharacterized protein n=1 Tax=Natrarchaeobaculum aegyptiacum TaxID=745377 RepID=A0A2Z2HPS7_9EURY|nr:DUF5799 family protein [Natrarchaeobaculum aegyptiacum]ARS89011.1 hypothetical protein B1756_04080 [Natrarchaeobaculum aegyptiacum]
MSDSSWTDRIVGDRMTVDQQFASQIDGSEFSNQQWSLIMTATEFEIENPGDPERARIVANTEQVDQIIPELDNIQAGMGGMGGAQGGSGGSGGSGSVVDSIKGALGLGGGSGDSHAEQLEAAERLTQRYADELQSHLESEGKWDAVREMAADEA